MRTKEDINSLINSIKMLMDKELQCSLVGRAAIDMIKASYLILVESKTNKSLQRKILASGITDYCYELATEKAFANDFIYRNTEIADALGYSLFAILWSCNANMNFCEAWKEALDESSAAMTMLWILAALPGKDLARARYYALSLMHEAGFSVAPSEAPFA